MTQFLATEGETLDDLQIRGYRIIQAKDRFRFGIDAVLLSSFAQVKEGERVLDLGTGTGILPSLLAAKTQGEHFTGLEINEESASMAARSVALNRLEDRISIVRGDIKEADRIFPVASFHVVVSNPPYMKNSGGLKNADPSVAAARHEVLCTLEDVTRSASRMLGNAGRFYMVHRPFRLPEIIRCMSRFRLEPKRLRMVYPYADKEPSMILIEGRKGAGEYLRTEPPLVIYEKDGEYTQEVKRIYGILQ